MSAWVIGLTAYAVLTTVMLAVARVRERRRRARVAALSAALGAALARRARR